LRLVCQSKLLTTERNRLVHWLTQNAEGLPLGIFSQSGLWPKDLRRLANSLARVGQNAVGARHVWRATSEKNCSGKRFQAWQYAPVSGEQGL